MFFYLEMLRFVCGVVAKKDASSQSLMCRNASIVSILQNPIWIFCNETHLQWVNFLSYFSKFD
jgi:hypothetical protein